MSKPVNVREVLREWVIRQMGDESQRSFAKRTRLKEPAISNLVNRKPGRQATLEWVEKIVAAQGSTISRALLELARIAYDLEEKQAMAKGPPAEVPAATPSPPATPPPPDRRPRVPMRPIPADAPPELSGYEIDVDAIRTQRTTPPTEAAPVPRKVPAKARKPSR